MLCEATQHKLKKKTKKKHRQEPAENRREQEKQKSFADLEIAASFHDL